MLIYYLSLLETQEEKDVLEAIYLNYRRNMKYRALQILENEEDAEDAVHETFLKMVKVINQLEYPLNKRVKSLIGTILQNACIDVLRKRKKYVHVREEKLAKIGGSKQPDPMAELNAKYIRQLIDELPQKYQEILLLKAHYDFSYEEIGNALGITAANARKRMQRARVMLREKLNQKR